MTPSGQSYSERRATFSSDGRYRYTLTRRWDPLASGPTVAFVGLNPSTADAREDDPTIRRCVGFARDWGFGGLVMLNLFAFRATDPESLSKVEDPVGPGNDALLATGAEASDLVVAAWGTHPLARARAREIIDSRVLFGWAALGWTKDGHPRHPLYMRRDCRPLDPRGGRVEVPSDRAARVGELV